MMHFSLHLTQSDDHGIEAGSACKDGPEELTNVISGAYKLKFI